MRQAPLRCFIRIHCCKGIIEQVFNRNLEIGCKPVRERERRIVLVCFYRVNCLTTYIRDVRQLALAKGMICSQLPQAVLHDAAGR